MPHDDYHVYDTDGTRMMLGCEHDYFYSRRERLLPLRRLLPLLLLRLEDTGVAPKILFPTFEPKPYPLYLYALFSITCQLFL